jgi:hypothetical protein
MADRSVTVQPPTLDLYLYAGDGVSFKVICRDNQSPPQPVNVTGDVEAQIRSNRLSTDPPVATFSADMSGADQGEIVLSLTGDDTHALMATATKDKFTGVWDCQWTPTGGQPRTLCQGKVECAADVTR